MKSHAAATVTPIHNGYAGNIPFEDPLLKPFIKSYQAGDALFAQGEVGMSLYIIVEGVIQLTAVRDEQELFISELGAGHVLGEKAIVGRSPHKRFFGARVKAAARVLELSAADMETLEKKNPSIVIRIFERIGKVSVERLDRIDHLIKVLRPANNVERLVYLIIHFCHFEGKKTESGTKIHLPMDTIRYYLSMTPFDIEHCFADLNRLGIVIDEGKSNYRMVDQAKLIASILTLRDSLPDIATV